MKLVRNSSFHPLSLATRRAPGLTDELFGAAHREALIMLFSALLGVTGMFLAAWQLKLTGVSSEDDMG